MSSMASEAFEDGAMTQDEQQVMSAATPTHESSTSPTPDDIKAGIVAAVKTVYDPEIPVDIYELGLVYEINVADDGAVNLVMTLTTPMCPAAEILPPEVEAKTRAVEGVKSVDLELVWDPPWSPEMMSEAARLELNL